ncbi:hypothetical protein EMCRGX_G020960 [Ephydatia muelleri]
MLFGHLWPLTIICTWAAIASGFPLSSFYPFGQSVNDSPMNERDDNYSPPILLPSSVKFFGSFYQSLQVANVLLQNVDKLLQIDSNTIYESNVGASQADWPWCSCDLDEQVSSSQLRSMQALEVYAVVMTMSEMMDQARDELGKVSEQKSELEKLWKVEKHNWGVEKKASTS